jgi:uncharacterized protein (DUF983 family)
MAQSNGYGAAHATVDDRPIGELFQDLVQDTRTLVSLELDLAKTELSDKASKTGKDIGFMAAGGFVIYAGFLAIIAAVIIGLAELIPLWLSALIVGIVVALVGYALLRKGMSDLKSRSLAPTETLDSLKRDKEWLRDQVT